jgi:hypothetical protein
MTQNPQLSGVDLARVALRAAKATAQKNGGGRTAQPKPRATMPFHPRLRTRVVMALKNAGELLRRADNGELSVRGPSGLRMPMRPLAPSAPFQQPQRPPRKCLIRRLGSAGWMSLTTVYRAELERRRSSSCALTSSLPVPVKRAAGRPRSNDRSGGICHPASRPLRDPTSI